MNPNFLESLPHYMRDLPIHKGFPVPFFAAVKDGIPDPRLSDLRKAKACAKRRLCWVCGKALTPVVTFVGGPLSALNGRYSDGPMHEECSTFALKVCPYLAIPNKDRRAKESECLGAEGFFAEKPAHFVQLFSKGFIISPDPQYGFTFVVPSWARIKEVKWKDGEQLPS